nr:SEC-C domain-containing protein [Bradyrhizobium sp. SZCCHNRI1029]
MAKIGRNQSCPCGSGKKYKHCHGRYGGFPGPLPNPQPPAFNAAEFIRRQQQGKGKPIVAAKAAQHQIVAVGNTVHFSTKWKTFPDFLMDYIKGKLGKEWVTAEAAKAPEQQHPLMQWGLRLFEYQKETIKNPGQITSAPMTGVVAAYLGTAYALYLLEHNVELQERLLKRLKDIGQFQGAYYELLVAGFLIKAGFKLTLEDETDGKSKHCEFAAISSTTGKRYWVEAKMRSVAGLLGKTKADGGVDGKPLARLIPHLNDALAKPAADDRLIFIDVNTPTKMTGTTPDWVEPAMRRLEQFEKKENKTGSKAIIFATNVAYHRELDQPPAAAGVAFGLGMPDFRRPGLVRVTDAYRARKKYADAYEIADSFQRYLNFPVTFDGSLPSEAFGGTQGHLKIGESYFFPDSDGGKGIAGTVTAVSVDENKKELIVAVSDDNQTALLKYPMTDAELAEWREFGDAIFGKEPRRTKAHCENAYDLFEFFMDANRAVSRDELLKRCVNLGQDIEKLNDEDLLMLYCEALVSSATALPAPPKSPPQIDGRGWLLKAVLGPDGAIQLWDIFIYGEWVGSKRTERQCYEVIKNVGLSPNVAGR